MALGVGVPIGKQAALTIDGTAGGIGLTVPTITPTPDYATVTVEAGPIRYWVDGSAPTSAQGHLVADGGVFRLEGRDELKKFRAIRSTGVSAVIQVTFGCY